MDNSQPEIGVVIIGVNVERYLSACIRSVLSADYPEACLELVYVDGGSMDNSVKTAKRFDGVKVIELNDRHPTPGRGRNAGWQALSTPLIQFLDADTVLDPLWFRNALSSLADGVGGVCGHRREQFPDKNLFHVLTDMEWRYELGPCRYFGGDVLVKREILEQTGGFDKDLVAGEDPELSYRIRQAGWQILRIDAPMTLHDINMGTLRQYFRRAFRSGYAYAEIGLRFARAREKLWLRELLRISIKALFPVALVCAGIGAGAPWTGVVLGLAILFRPILHLHRLKRTFQKPIRIVFLYACHSALVVYPQFAGAMRFLFGRIFSRPLKNKGMVPETNE